MQHCSSDNTVRKKCHRRREHPERTLKCRLYFLLGFAMKLLEMGLGMAALYYLETQYYLYYNRVGDVMTMVGVMGGLLASFHLLLLYFCGCKTMSGQLLLLLMYGFLNTVMGILLLVEILNYDLCKNYLLMAILVKSLGIVMLFDFLRTYHYQCVCYPTSCSVCKKKRGPKSEPNPARRYYFCTNICRKCSCFEMNKSY